MQQPKELTLTFKLSVRDRERLERLSAAWGVSLAGAIRRAIQEANERAK